MNRVAIRNAFLQGFVDQSHGGNSIMPDFEGDDDGHQAEAWLAGRRYHDVYVKDAARRHAESLEPLVDTGANFPYEGHVERVEDGRRVCTWTVTIPGDIFAEDGESRTFELNALRSYAIYYTREEVAEDWCVPADWTATLTSGEPGDFEVTFEVTRYSTHRG